MWALGVAQRKEARVAEVHYEVHWLHQLATPAEGALVVARTVEACQY